MYYNYIRLVSILYFRACSKKNPQNLFRPRLAIRSTGRIPSGLESWLACSFRPVLEMLNEMGKSTRKAHRAATVPQNLMLCYHMRLVAHTCTSTQQSVNAQCEQCGRNDGGEKKNKGNRKGRAEPGRKVPRNAVKLQTSLWAGDVAGVSKRTAVSLSPPHHDYLSVD